MDILPDKYFETVFGVTKSYTAVCFNYFLSMEIFLFFERRYIQGSVNMQCAVQGAVALC